MARDYRVAAMVSAMIAMYTKAHGSVNTEKLLRCVGDVSDEHFAERVAKLFQQLGPNEQGEMQMLDVAFGLFKMQMLSQGMITELLGEDSNDEVMHSCPSAAAPLTLVKLALFFILSDTGSLVHTTVITHPHHEARMPPDAQSRSSGHALLPFP